MGNFLGAAGLTRVWNKIAATYLKLSGGSMTGQLTVASIRSSNGAGYSGGIQLREYNYTTTSASLNQTDAPGITFHWGGRVVDKLYIYSDAQLYWGSSVVLNSSNYSSYAIPKSGGTMTGDLAFSNNVGISGTMGGGTDNWGIVGTGDNDNGRLKIFVGDNGISDWMDFEFHDYSGTLYTPLSMTGNQVVFGAAVGMPANLYTDSYTGALNMSNSNIYGVNSIYTSDASDDQAEGIHFYRDSTHVDTLRMASGALLFTPNRPLGGTGTEYTVWHSGNSNASNIDWTCSVLGCGESIHMGNGKQANLEAEGWYRVWTSNGAAEGSVIIRLTHNYWYNYSDGVILAISFDYGHATITQLAGSTYGSEIYSVRFSGDAGTRYIDFYYNANSINSVWVSTIGVGVSQVPTAISNSETISNSTEWVVQDNAFGTSGDALIKNTLKVEGVIFGYHYTKHHDWAAFVFDKPGSYLTGIGPNGSANTIHFGPCGQSGEWVTELYQTWDFFGNIYAAGTITAGSASDKRLKKNIEALDINDAKNIIVNSRAVRFKWTDKATELSDQLKGDDIGLIAQEVESLVPSAISSIFNNYLRLDYTKFIAPIIKVEQDLLERVEKLEKENEELKRQLKN